MLCRKFGVGISYSVGSLSFVFDDIVCEILRVLRVNLYCRLLACLTVCAVVLTLKVLVMTIDAQWEGMGGVGSARYESALLPPMPDHKGFKLQKFSTLRVNASVLH